MVYFNQSTAPRIATTVVLRTAQDPLSLAAKFRTDIQADSGHGWPRVLTTEYVTSRGYDLEAMYQTVVIEGNRRCRS